MSLEAQVQNSLLIARRWHPSEYLFWIAHTGRFFHFPAPASDFE